jgi:hypothetical protein
MLELTGDQSASDKCKRKTQRNFTDNPDYEFVTWTDPFGNTDAAARKAVRSHTMRHRKPVQEQPNSPCEIHHSPGPLIRIHTKVLKNEFKTYLASMPREISTLDPFDSLPTQMRPYMLELFNKCKCLLFVHEILAESLILTYSHNLCL